MGFLFEERGLIKGCHHEPRINLLNVPFKCEVHEKKLILPLGEQHQQGDEFGDGPGYGFRLFGRVGFVSQLHGLSVVWLVKIGGG